MKAKNLLIGFFTLLVILASCQNAKEKKQNKDADSSMSAEESAINKMIDEMAPPDSTYSGEFFLKYDNGLMKAKGYFRFGKRHGQWYYYYPNGYLWSDGYFDKGKMDGPTKVYHENGKMYYEGAYKNDKAIGVWNFFDSTGAKIFIRTYDSLGNVLSDQEIPPVKK
jgi:antitoxin component YwqK of YwqJK toxin-antitoxin module